MSIESRLKTVRRNTGNHKSESAMSKENLKKNKKNYWFSITLIALAVFCVGAALLYSQKLLSEKLSKLLLLPTQHDTALVPSQKCSFSSVICCSIKTRHPPTGSKVFGRHSAKRTSSIYMTNTKTSVFFR